MRLLWTFVVSCVLFVCSTASATLDDDGMLVLEGKRTFVVGTYEYPVDDAVLHEVAEAGFNLVAAPDRPSIERAYAAGLYSWTNAFYAFDFSVDQAAREQLLKQAVETIADHPGLAVWELPDEVLWQTWYLANWFQTNDEPAQQRGWIEKLEDKALAEKLTAMREEATRLFQRGDFVESEKLVDRIWELLGEPIPGPEMRITNAPARAAKIIEGFRQGIAFMKSLDPNHPVWANHAPRNSLEQLTAFNEVVDIVGCDIYPVPPSMDSQSDLMDRTLSAVGSYTRYQQASAPGKPVWMVLQAFNWAQGIELKSGEPENQRDPSPEELRFMTYDAIVNGARGVAYFGTYTLAKDSQLWKDVLDVARELKSLQHVISARDATVGHDYVTEQSWGTLDRRVVVLPKQVGADVWFLVVNEWDDPVRYTIRGLESLEGKRYVDERDERSAVVRNGQINLGISGYGVQVLRPQEFSFFP